MSTAQKLIGGLVAVALVTTAVLPGRMTPQVINAAANFMAKTFGTVMGTAKPA